MERESDFARRSEWFRAVSCLVAVQVSVAGGVGRIVVRRGSELRQGGMGVRRPVVAVLEEPVQDGAKAGCACQG